MNIDQNIVYIQQNNASPLPQIKNFHAKAHCLRSRAIGDFFNKLVSFIINLPKRLLDHRHTRLLYNELSLMDKDQLRDIGLTRNDVERIRLGRAGVQAIQQDYAATRVKNTLEQPAAMEREQKAGLPSVVAQ